MSVSGGCLCGAVRYAVERVPAAALNCHCARCRKAHGAACVPFAVVSKRHFRWLCGVDNIAGFSAASGFVRQFCRACGAHLAVLEDWNPNGITIAMGSFDADPDIVPQGHMFVDSAAPWHEITDGLPQYAAWPSGLGPDSQAVSER